MWLQTSLCLLSILVTSQGNVDMAEPTIQVSMDLLQAAMGETTDNCIISPVSVSSLLSILQQGAMGDALTQLSEALHVDASQSRKLYGKLTRALKKNNNSSVIIEYATKAFVKDGFDILAPFKKILVREFHSDIDQLDYSDSNAAAKEINSWVKKQTRGKIDEIVTPEILDADVQLLLANAMYFKGIWSSPFKPEKTLDKPFSTIKGKKVVVPTMHRVIFLRAAEESLGYKWIELPFEGEQFSMYVVLPDENISANTLLEQITKNDRFTSILKSKRRRNVDIALPKFNLSTQMDLIKALKLMGIKDIFSKEKSNLQGISDKPLFVSQVLHQVNLSIDEKGGAAASSTGVVLKLRSAIDSPVDVMDFEVNRPFLVFIVDKVNMIPLFAGQVTDPTKT